MEKVNTTQAEAAGGKEGTKKLGAFLRSEREKLELSQDQIAQKMRLRRFVIEAIENEAWDRLPPPVFVRGFLRSYAKTLGLDEKQALELYRLTAPPEQDTLKPVAVARPTYRGRALFFVGVMVLIVCAAYYWHVRSTMRERQSTVSAERPAPAKKAEVPALPAPAPLSDGPAETEPLKSPEGEERIPELVEQIEVQEETGLSVEKAAEGAPQTREPAVEPVSRPQSLILQGRVKETTWVRIRVDGGEAKEYIFQPGASPQWIGRNDFEITIGNAAGIDLDFEGERMENLGRPGQVIRMRLP